MQKRKLNTISDGLQSKITIFNLTNDIALEILWTKGTHKTVNNAFILRDVRARETRYSKLRFLHVFLFSEVTWF